MLTPVCRRVQYVVDAGAVGVLLGSGAKVVLPARGSTRASMVLLQVFALLRVASLRVHRNAVDSDQLEALPR